MQEMCNLSGLVEERAAKRERIEAIKRMLKADAAKEQIISFGYSEEDSCNCYFNAYSPALQAPITRIENQITRISGE